MKKTPKPVEEDWDIIPQDELRRRCLKYKGPNSPGPRGQPRSTKIRYWDLAILMKDHEQNFRKWIAGNLNYGNIRRRRLSRIIRLVDAGMITKIKHGKYVFHDHPVAQPVREMRVNIGVGGVSLTRVQNEAPPKAMPDFKSVFGGRK